MTSSSEVVIIMSIFYYVEIWYFNLVNFNLINYFVMGLFSHYYEISVRHNCNVTFAVAANQVVIYITAELKLNRIYLII